MPHRQTREAHADVGAGAADHEAGLARIVLADDGDVVGERRDVVEQPLEAEQERDGVAVGVGDDQIRDPIPIDVARGEITWALLRGGVYSAGFLGVMLAMGLIDSWWAVLALPATLLIGYAFAELKLHRLEANIQPANVASIALVRSCGFRKEGFSPRYLKIAGRWRDQDDSGGPIDATGELPGGHHFS